MKHFDRSEIKLLSGASIGLFSAYALSSGKLKICEDIYRNIDIPKKAELFWQVFGKHLLENTVDEFVALGDTVTIPLCFPVCYMPVCSVRYYWVWGEYNPFWKKYLRAAINFPFLRILPTVLHGRFALDGGAADNIPLYPILKKGGEYLKAGEELDLVLVLHFDARYDYRAEFSVKTPVLDLDLSICNQFKKRHYDFSSAYVEEMLQKGEEYGERIAARLLQGDCSREGLQKKVNEIFLEEHTERQRNVSIDRALSLFNYVGKALRSDASCNKKLF